MDGTMDEIDRISSLPDFVLHLILSFLGRKDANQTCVLSKRWKFIWDTFPIFDFDQYVHIRDFPVRKPEYMQQAREFMNFVDKSLQKFTRHKLLMERLFINLPLVEYNSVSMVDKWVALSLDNGVREMSLMISSDADDFSTGNYTFYTLPETTFASKSIGGSPKLDRLQKLELNWINMNESVIQNIVLRCPNLNHLRLENFRGLKTLKISKLDKLETVSIVSSGFMRDLERVIVDAQNLKYFCLSCDRRQSCTVSLSSCHDLKELHLVRCRITDSLLHSFLSRFPLLEVLEINRCSTLQKVKISAQRLRRLQLTCLNDDIEMVQIDAPILSLFEFVAIEIPILFLENVPCLMNITHGLYRKVVDSSWFSDLREFLGLLSQRKFFTLKFYKNKVSFDLEELGDGKVPPPVEIDHLTLTSTFTKAEVDCDALIDGLLWSCHPKIISVPSDSIFQKDCIKVLCTKLLEREHPLCCNSSHIRCWRHHLKDAKIERFGKMKATPLLHSIKALLDRLPSLGKRDEVHFKLEWSF